VPSSFLFNAPGTRIEGAVPLVSMTIPTTEDIALRQSREAATPRTSVFSRCNLPPWVIASVRFQEEPQPLEIDGVRTADKWLFERLADIADADERGRMFHDYVSVKFRLHEWEQYGAAAGASLRSSYLQFLHGWSADSNGREGAVLKGWVESRFGLRATFHRGKLAVDPAAREHYWYDRMHGAERTMGLAMQFDLLHTFCQEELRRRHGPDARWVTLYRGTHDPDEYEITPDTSASPPSPENLITSQYGEEKLIRLNCLSSFTSDKEVAWEFGSRVWEVRVPLAKVFFFSGLLQHWLLGGESEWLVLGGEYRVRQLRW
jgi:NAD+--dinitrogen-reductase ADP-D-ribosyltransferase